MKRLLTLLLVVISVNVFGQKLSAPTGVTPLTQYSFYAKTSDSTLHAYSGSTWLWWKILSKKQGDALYQPIGVPSPLTYSLSAGYGLSGTSFNGSANISWTADTTSATGLVSKSRLATNLTGYVPKTTTLTINGATRDLSVNRTWNVGTVLSVGATAGTGISIAGTSPITSSGTYTITNTAPDQTVSLTAGTGISTSGTYPNFTITNTSPSSGGTVTSITPGYGLTPQTAITSSGGFAVDTLVLDTVYAKPSDIPTNYWTTNTTQTGLTGDKSTTGNITADSLKVTGGTSTQALMANGSLYALQDSLTKKANRTFDNVASGAINVSKLTGVLPIANGGTGSATQNFVDLTTAQTITGVKEFNAGVRHINGTALSFYQTTDGTYPSSVINISGLTRKSSATLSSLYSDGYFRRISGSFIQNYIFQDPTSNGSINFPVGSGTLALTSDLTGGYVPYTGATSSLNLGANSLTAQNLTISGNSEFSAQSIWKGGASIRMQNTANTQFVSFQAASLTSSYIALLPSKTGTQTFAMITDLTSGYLPLTAGSGSPLTGALYITTGEAIASGYKAIQLPTGVSATIGAGLSTRVITGESIIQFGNNHYAAYTGTIDVAKAGAMIRLDTRNATPIPGSAAYSVFQIQVRGAGVAAYTVPVQVSGLAPSGALTIGSTGLVSAYYGLSAGASTFSGALTGTSATFSEAITSSKTSTAILTNTVASTSQKYIEIVNTGAQLYTGNESSVGASVVAGAGAYSSFISTGNATSIVFGTNLTARYTIDASGNNTWTGTGELQGGIFIIGKTTPTTNGSSYLNFQASNIVTNWQIGQNKNVSGALEFVPSTAGGGSTYSNTVGVFTSAGFFKASNDGAYLGLLSPYHEFNSSSAASVLTLRNTASNPFGLYVELTTITNNGTNAIIDTYDGANRRFTVYSNGGIANYSANNVNLSDERVKRDIVKAGSYWDIIKAIEFDNYKYKDATDSRTLLGVMAQQVEKIKPEWVSNSGSFGKASDGTNLKTVYEQQLQYGVNIVVQESMKRIEALEAEVKILKSK